MVVEWVSAIDVKLSWSTGAGWLGVGLALAGLGWHWRFGVGTAGSKGTRTFLLFLPQNSLPNNIPVTE